MYYVQDVSSQRGKETDEGLTRAVELFCGNGAAEWAPCHVAMVMLVGGCGDPPFMLYTGLGLYCKCRGSVWLMELIY